MSNLISNSSRPRAPRRPPRRCHPPGAAAVGPILLVLSLCSCGGGGVTTPIAMAKPPSSTTTEVSACGRTLPAPPDPAEVRVLWGGAWDERDAPALLERWDEQRRDVDLTVDSAETPSMAARALLDADPPTLAKVPSDMVPALAHAGAISPLGPCVSSAPAPIG